jgi:hypothetical protein
LSHNLSLSNISKERSAPRICGEEAADLGSGSQRIRYPRLKDRRGKRVFVVENLITALPEGFLLKSTTIQFDGGMKAVRPPSTIATKKEDDGDDH